MLIADVFVAEIDELMNHYPVREEYAHQLGEYLANISDTNSFRAMAIGSETAHAFDSAYDGQLIQHADMATDAAALQAAVYDTARYFDEKDVPESDRYIGVKPVQYFKLLTDGEFINRDYNDPNGSRAKGVVEYAAGIQILKTNNIPQADDSANTEVDLQLRADFTDLDSGVSPSTVTACAWQKRAIATVQLKGVTAEQEYSARHQGTLLLAKVAQGQNFVRPEAIAVLADIN